MATPHSFGAQNFPFGVLSTFGTTHIAHSAIGGQLLGSKVVGYTPTDEVDDGYNLQPVGKLKSISAMPAYGSSSHEELRWEDYQIGMAPYPSGAQNFPFGITSRLGITNTTKKHVVLSHRGSDFVGVNSTQPASKFESISAMAVYKDRSHEELRWEDYQMERNPFMFGAQSFPFGGQRLGTRVVSYTSTVEVDCGGSTQPTVKPISPMSYSSTALNSPFVTTHRYGTTAIGRPAFGGQSLGSHVVSYTPTAEIELGIIQSASKIQSISAMQVLKDKSHEEMRWEDYQLGYKGRSDLAFQSAANVAVFGKPLKQPNFPYPSGLNLPAITNTNSYGLFQSAAPSLEQTTSVIGLNFTPSSIQPRGVVDNLFSSNSKQFVEPVLTSGAFLCNNCGQTQAGPSGFGGEMSQDIVGQSPISQSAMIMQDLVNLFRTPLEYGSESEPNFASRTDQRLNQIHDSDSYIKKDSTITLTGERGEDVIGADIEPLMPKLRHTDYYTEPRIQELAARERNETGFCRHVKDFVIGRLGYGSIKFTGDTDVVGLDLESLVGFNHREVVVYMKSSKNPHEGQFYNKDAEVTLLNIMCIDKKTGQKYTEGPKVEKYKKMLMKSAEEQGAESVSYDPVKGEWKLKVKHFNLSDQQGEDC